MFLRWLLPLVAASLLVAASPSLASADECAVVRIPIIGNGLLTEANDSYSRGDFQGAIARLERFIELNRTQLTEGDEPLSGKQRQCLGRLVDEYDFRLAHIYQVVGEQNKAEDALRDILVANPKHYNARLALAQIMAHREDYRTALYHLHLALAGSAPEPVQNDIRGILSRVNRSPAKYFNFFAAIAPDTNINRATRNREIDLDINGTSLPFLLGEDSVASSGIGVVLSANARYETPVSKNLLLRFDGIGSWLNYRGSEVDDVFLRSQMGFRRLYDNGSVSAQAILARDWYAGSGFARDVGARLSWDHNLLSLFRYGASVEKTWRNHDDRKDIDGTQTSVSLFSTYQLTASSQVNANFTWTNKTSQVRRFGYNQEAINLGYIREFPWGLTTNLSQYVGLRAHKDIEPFFAEQRTDVLARSFLQVTKRDWTLWGLAPVISYSLTRNFSNIDLFSYTRHQVQFGLTKLL